MEQSTETFDGEPVLEEDVVSSEKEKNSSSGGHLPWAVGGGIIGFLLNKGVTSFDHSAEASLEEANVTNVKLTATIECIKRTLALKETELAECHDQQSVDSVQIANLNKLIKELSKAEKTLRELKSLLHVKDSELVDKVKELCVVAPDSFITIRDEVLTVCKGVDAVKLGLPTATEVCYWLSCCDDAGENEINRFEDSEQFPEKITVTGLEMLTCVIQHILDMFNSYTALLMSMFGQVDHSWEDILATISGSLKRHRGASNSSQLFLLDVAARLQTYDIELMASIKKGTTKLPSAEILGGRNGWQICPTFNVSYPAMQKDNNYLLSSGPHATPGVEFPESRTVKRAVDSRAMETTYARCSEYFLTIDFVVASGKTFDANELSPLFFPKEIGHFGVCLNPCTRFGDPIRRPYIGCEDTTVKQGFADMKSPFAKIAEPDPISITSMQRVIDNLVKGMNAGSLLVRDYSGATLLSGESANTYSGTFFKNNRNESTGRDAIRASNTISVAKNDQYIKALQDKDVLRLSALFALAREGKSIEELPSRLSLLDIDQALLFGASRRDLIPGDKEVLRGVADGNLIAGTCFTVNLKLVAPMAEDSGKPGMEHVQSAYPAFTDAPPGTNPMANENSKETLNNIVRALGFTSRALGYKAAQAGRDASRVPATKGLASWKKDFNIEESKVYFGIDHSSDSGVWSLSDEDVDCFMSYRLWVPYFDIDSVILSNAQSAANTLEAVTGREARVTS